MITHTHAHTCVCRYYRYPGEIKRREVELGCESWTSFASGCSSTVVQQTLSLSLCPSTAVETAVGWCTSHCAMARGHHLNTSIVLVVVHGQYPHSFIPFTLSSPSPPHPVPVPNKHPHFCGCKAIWSNVIHVVHVGFPKCTNTILNLAQDRAAGE